MTGRHIATVAFDGVHTLDLVGPLEVFSAASRLLSRSTSAYRLSVLARRREPVRTSSGLRLYADLAWSELDLDQALDTLFVPGGEGTRDAMNDPHLLSWLRGAAPRARRVCSVCTGAFVLAESGLLEGRRATTHWAWAKRLQARFPEIQVEPDAIFVRDGKLCTSAGVTSGIDLALALVEEDHGKDLALAVARQLVVFLKRPGGQSQFSAELASQFAETDSVRDAQRYILEHIDCDLRVPVLAQRVGMSPRNFARVFSEETGHTPARWVERARLEAARRLLEDGSGSLDEIAGRCGFGQAERMRRAFQRRLGVGPSDYRRRFSSPWTSNH